jgi:hypothetical protein
MRILFIFFFSVLFLCCKPSVPTSSSANENTSTAVVPANSKKFRIEIHQSSMMMDEVLIFNGDSVFVKSKNYPSNFHDTIFVNRKPSAEETERITTALAKINPDSIHLEKPAINADDGIEFTFIINNGIVSRQIDLYLQKENNLLMLTQTLNTLLPDGKKIDYNQHYLENGY